METAPGIGHGGIRGHNKFQKTRTWIRQGHDMVGYGDTTNSKNLGYGDGKDTA